MQSARNQRKYKDMFEIFEIHMEILHSRIASLYEKRKRLYLELDAIIQNALVHNGGSAEDDWMIREIQIILLQDPRLCSDRQEPTINIESEIDNKKSDDEMHQLIELVETEKIVDDLSQAQAAQQQQESQHQTVEFKTVETIVQDRQQLQSPVPEQLLSIDSPIKMVNIYAMQEELKWSVIRLKAIL